MKALFDKVGKFWPPRPRSKKQLDEQPAAEVADPPTEADPPADDVVASDPKDEEPLRVEDGESSMDDLVNDGASTPPVSTKMNDEYLAWTLGGELRQTPSPGPPWKPDTPKEQQELDDAVQSLEDADLDKRIQMLENLVGEYWDCYFLFLSSPRTVPLNLFGTSYIPVQTCLGVSPQSPRIQMAERRIALAGQSVKATWERFSFSMGPDSC